MKNKDRNPEKNVYIRNQAEFIQFYSTVIDERELLEETYARNCNESGSNGLKLNGFCEVCETKTEFMLDFKFSNNLIPNFRESMICLKCKMNSRQRHIVATIKKEYVIGQKIYMYEQITKVFKEIQKFASDVIGSEYVADGLLSGTIINGILHENAECLSFSDDTFDCIISCDVFEHVNDYKRCFAESFRVLRPGGKLYMQIPFYPLNHMNRRRAEIKNGDTVYYEKPIYHGNPMSDEGSLVFWDYGWQTLDDLKSVGFHDAFMQPYYGKEYGYLGGVPCEWVAIK